VGVAAKLPCNVNKGEGLGYPKCRDDFCPFLDNNFPFLIGPFGTF